LHLWCAVQQSATGCRGGTWYRNAAPAVEAYTTIGPQHVGFAHQDVDGVIAQLKPAIAPTDYVDDGHYRRAYFEDPDGIELELVQQL
jgi:catechol 2,3-dioxygenase-like lactoylglutathione lyase family enzyme